MPVFIKAASLALTQYPGLNCHIDAKAENITYKGIHQFVQSHEYVYNVIVI